MAKKHKLTKKTDHIDGINGKDLFLAPMFEVNGHERATLSNKDVLNGRGGIDTISAFIAADALTPILKNIEKAVFTRNDTDALALDLAKAAKLSNIQLKNLDSDVDITHAGRLANFTVKNSLEHSYTIDGINAAKVEKLSLNFVNAGVTQDGGLHLGLKLLSGGAFKQMEVSLNNSFVDLKDSHGTEKLTIHSKGANSYNEFFSYLNPDQDVTKTIVIDGDVDLVLNRKATDGSYYSSASLENFNASAMTGDLYAILGGVKLTSVKTGSGNDEIVLNGLGSTASVNLGSGNDGIYFQQTVLFNAAGHVIDGGDGIDVASFHSSLVDIASVFHNFETLKVWDATGTYDLAGSGITRFEVKSAAGAVTLNNVASGTNLVLGNTATTSTTVNVLNAANSTDDSLDLLLNGGAFGSAINGFNAQGLSHLNIESNSKANTLYLGQLGTVADPVKISVTGDKHLNLFAAASNINISELIIDNAAGVDLSGLMGIYKVFLSTAATTTGGTGNDVLVGGSGNDVISTGGGNDILHGSLGHDTFDFMGAAGNDILKYASAAQSVVNAEDWIINFGAGDKIDLSALASNIGFVGTFSNITDAKAQFSGTKINAYFNDQDHRLYVDTNNDHVIGSADFRIYIPDIDIFGGSFLL